MERVYTILYKSHQHWRYMIFMFAAIAIVSLVIGLFSQKKWRPLGRVSSLLFVIMIDIQVLIGLALWFVGERWKGADPERSWEHPTIMLLAVALVHIGSVKAKKGEKDDLVRYKTMLNFAFAAMVVVLFGVYKITKGLP
ncbi:hypothetical protein [Candidatus Uabimicrobium sp. HlEnr_7]|uniref:hypothetical protein n=1 Tax=Candidatus Uabimicrobium helgolandensis TaxID=3095367 RepID=UPI0035578CE1